MLKNVANLSACVCSLQILECLNVVQKVPTALQTTGIQGGSIPQCKPCGGDAQGGAMQGGAMQGRRCRVGRRREGDAGWGDAGWGR